MAKSFKFCSDCQCVHAKGECGTEDRRKDHKKRDRVRQAESMQYDFSDPLTLDH